MLSTVGLAFFIFVFAFSPKIPVAISGRLVLARLDDFLVPALFLVWLSELLLKKRRLVYSRLYIPAGTYFIVGLIATLAGYYKYYPLADPLYGAGVVFRSAEYYIIFFLTVNILKTKKQLIAYLNIWVAAAALIAVYEAADHIFGISGPSGLYDRGWFFSQSNHMGGFLMVSLIVALGLLDLNTGKRSRLRIVLALALIAYAILFNLSRSTYLSVLAALAVFYALHNKKLLVVPLVCAIVLFVVIPGVLPGTALGRRTASVVSDIFSTRADPRHEFDSLALHRGQFFYVFRDFSRDMLFGKGWGFYPLQTYDSQVALVPVATGLIGSAVFIWLLASIYKAALGVYKTTADAQLRILSKVFIAVYCGIALNSMVSVAFMAALIAYPFWLLAGIICSIPRLSSQQND